MVYRRARKDEDYTNYKEALNAAMTEIKQSKRSYEQRLACNVNNDSKSFMHMSGVDKTRQGCAGNIISQGFLMVEDLNEYFSSVYIREDISSLPVQMLNFRRLNRIIYGS